MYTVVYLAVETDTIQNIPVGIKEPAPHSLKKRRFSRPFRNKNKLKQQRPVTKGCFNCCHHLSKFYYWKQSPCDSCHRSPAYYYYLPTHDLDDNWHPIENSWTSRRNLFYWEEEPRKNSRWVKTQWFNIWVLKTCSLPFWRLVYSCYSWLSSYVSNLSAV